MTPQSKFFLLQSAAQATSKAVWDMNIDLAVKYGSGNAHYASKGDRNKLESLRKRASKAADRFYVYLATLSPRSWETGPPCRWLITDLTYEDAITAGQLAVVPPPAWGHTQADMERFAWPVKGQQA